MTPHTLALAGLLLAAGRPDAEVPLLTNAYDQAAAEIVATLDNMSPRQTHVRVGEFTPTGFPASSGNGVAQDLAAALNKAKSGFVGGDARYQVNGDVMFVKSEDDPDQKVVKFDFRLIDTETGKKFDLSHSFRVNGSKEIVRIVQADVRLDEEGTKAERNQQIQAAVKKPAVAVAGTKVKAVADSPYAVELLARDAGGRFAAKQPEARGGRAFAFLDRTDVYRVRVHNASAAEVAVAVFVDGINCCHFCDQKKKDGTPAFQFFIVDAKATQDVLGWLVGVKGDAVDYKEFLVTENGKGAASLVPTAAKGKVGAVTVQFAKCYERTTDGLARGNDATGFGARFSVKQKSVKRDIDVPFEFVNVRYARE